MDGQTLTADDLLKEIFFLEKAVLSLKTKILKVMPVRYGSEAWWEKMDKKAIESIRVGKGKRFNTYKEAISYLNS